MIAQHRRNINRCAGERDRRALGAIGWLSSVDPIDATLDALSDEKFDFRGKISSSLRRAREVKLQRLVDCALAQQLDAGCEVAQRGRQFVLKRARRRHPTTRWMRALARFGAAPNTVEERLASRLRIHAGTDRVIDLIDGKPRTLDARERALAIGGVVQRAQQVLGARFGNANAEVAAGDLLEMMRLVKNHMVVGGKKAGALRTQREVAEEERVVADQKIGVLHAPPRRLIEALVVGRAASTHAIARVAFNMLPHAASRQDRQRRQRSIVGLVRPVLNQIERVLLLFIVANLALLLAGHPQAPQRNVISPALAKHGGELVGDHRLEQRHILLKDLFLQRNGVGAHDHPFAVLEDASNRGYEITEALADAGARLDQKLALGLEVALDRLGHAQLLRARFKRADATRKRALCPKEVSGKQRHGARVADDDAVRSDPAARRRELNHEAIPTTNRSSRRRLGCVGLGRDRMRNHDFEGQSEDDADPRIGDAEAGRVQTGQVVRISRPAAT